MQPPIDRESNKQFMGLVDFAQTLTSSGLQRERTLERSQKIFRKAALITDNRIKDVLTQLDTMSEEEREFMRPKCSDGCSHCCYQWVRSTATEVFAVSEYIRANWSPEQVGELLVRCQSYREEFQRHPAGSMFSLACPILDGNLCPVYDVRPFICRGCNSMDVQKCAEGREDPNSGVAIPIIMPVLMSAGAVRQGIQMGLEAVGYRPTELVFALALQTALTSADVADRFFSGEDVFANDVIPV